MSGSAIPVVRAMDQTAVRALGVIKTKLDTMGGQLQNFQRLAPLEDTASLAEVIERLNIMLDRMQR